VTFPTRDYESEFLGFSYGFRPEALGNRASRWMPLRSDGKRAGNPLDTRLSDVQSFFSIRLTRMVAGPLRFEHRIGDRRIIRLSSKWLYVAGVLE